jgi:ribonuclease BN (tRNA processing enzyme)
MRLTFLGTGGAFTRIPTNYHNNALIEINGSKYLIDCSLHALESLHELNIDPLDIEGIILTHLHGDHISGFEEMGFRGLFVGGGQTFDLFAHPNLVPSCTSKSNQGVLGLWENCLKGTMQHIQDENRQPKKADLTTYFDPYPNMSFSIGDCQFQFIPVDHVPDKHTYGLVVETPHNLVLYTADSRPFQESQRVWYKEADMIFHDCIFDPYYESTVHSHLEELLELPEDVQKKTHVMHYGDPEEWEQLDDTGDLSLARPHVPFDL